MCVNELDAVNLSFKARVILIGRTGLDDVARKLRGSEVVRVRTPIEAIAEVALPQDPESPRRVVVVVGTDSALSIEEFGEDGDGAAEFLRGLQSIHPRARLLRAVNRRNVQDPVAEGYHGSVAVDATPLEFVGAFTAASRMMTADSSGESGERRALAEREPVSGQLSATSEEPDVFFAGIREMSQETSQEEALPMTDSAEAKCEKAPPQPAQNGYEEMASYPSLMAAPGGVFVENFTSIAVPLYDNEPAPKSQSTIEKGPLLPAAASSIDQKSASDRMLGAMLAGRDVRVEALEIIREATGDPSVMLTDAADALPGAVVAFEGRPLAKLRARLSPESLAPHAAWLSQWLRLEQHVGELREWAFTDALTGAWNRRYFELFLSESVEEAQRLRRSLTVLSFDIDDFKRWNDENGHAAGDEILVETVKLLKSVIRPTDKVCRIGGDEFAVIFHEPQGPRDPGSHHPEDLFQIAKRFQQQIRSKRFPKLTATHTPLGISGGLATYPWDARTAEELIKIADQRAMQCKRQGKNAITFGDQAS